MTDHSFQLFEISWEVCNKVGGIHTVLSSKAVTAVRQFGDDYITIGPQLHGDTAVQLPFDDESGHDELLESCRQIGIPVRIGRWRIPGRPRCILVDFSGMYDQKDGVLAGLWERHQVDSIAGGWDYIEPVLFSIAAAKVIECWWETHLAPCDRRAVVQAHEWMTGASLLYLQERIPSIGTVFTTHATMLGRALASLGITPDHSRKDKGLGDQSVQELAEAHGVRSKHSLEGVCARKADAFTTVSEITAAEAELLHDRQAEPLLPNGIDLSVVGELSQGDRAETRRQLARIAEALLGEDVSDASFFALAGRYEFYNKGIELMLDALADIKGGGGKRIVAFILVPAGNSGVRSELMERLDGSASDGPLTGYCTHTLIDEQGDPVHTHCRQIGLDNQKGSRIKVVQIPIYLRPDDEFLRREYEAVLAGTDLGVYPSFYEPWGYTPQEALAVGVPTITTDLAGFGRWAESVGLGPRDGITVLKRERVPYEDVRAATGEAFENFLDQPVSHGMRNRCREAAERTAWRDLYQNYLTAYGKAFDVAGKRSPSGAL